MSEQNKIHWTDATCMVDRNGHWVRFYRKQNLSRPGQQERRQMAARGLKWCRGCEDWLPAEKVLRVGVCRPHANEEYRRFYERNPDAVRDRVHARIRGVEPLPEIGKVCLSDMFGGRCAYCPSDGTTWDHVVPVARGGQTVPGNMVPACLSCNSSKNATDVWEWLFRTCRVPNEDLVDVLLLVEIGMSPV